MKWVAPSSGGMTLLSTTTCSGVTTTVSAIDQTYTNLLIIVNNYKFDTDARYVSITLGSLGATGYQVNQTGNGDFTSTSTAYAASAALFPTYDNTVTNAQPFSFAMNINRYATADTVKTFSWNGVYYKSDVSALRALNGGGGYSSTTAVTSFALTNTGSRSATSGTIYVYGVK